MVRLAAHYTASPIPAESMAPAIQPPGAADPLNRGILIEGGTFRIRGGEPDTVVGGPYSTWDEGGGGQLTVDSFWIQEHEVTNEEYRRFDPGHGFPEGTERHPVVGITW